MHLIRGKNENMGKDIYIFHNVFSYFRDYLCFRSSHSGGFKKLRR